MKTDYFSKFMAKKDLILTVMDMTLEMGKQMEKHRKGGSFRKIQTSTQWNTP